jgi:hypothetical protein
LSIDAEVREHAIEVLQNEHQCSPGQTLEHQPLELGDRAHAEGLTKLGAFDFIYKPFQLATVEESVARALEHNRALKARRASGDG